MAEGGEPEVSFDGRNWVSVEALTSTELLEDHGTWEVLRRLLPKQGRCSVRADQERMKPCISGSSDGTTDRSAVISQSNARGATMNVVTAHMARNAANAHAPKSTSIARRPDRRRA